MTTVVTFPVPPAPASRGRRLRRKAEIATFPFGRRRHLVDETVKAMRALSRCDSEAYLEKVLLGICEEIRALGLECVDCAEDAAIDEFAEAVGKQLHGPDFQLDEVGVAK
jgi:hypothetical protein